MASVNTSSLQTLNNENLDFVDNYCSKLDVVFNLLLIDIPDTYDDTLNSKVLDSIKDLMKKYEKLKLNLSSYVQNRIVFVDLAHKDDEIQTFFLNLISSIFESIGPTSVLVIEENFLEQLIGYLSYCVSNKNTVVEYAALNLVVKAFSSCLKENLAFKMFIKRNYLDNLTIFYDKSIFICKLYENLIQLYLKNLYNCQSYEEIDDYFKEIKKFKDNFDVIFAFFDVLLSLYKDFKHDNQIIEHLDFKLKNLLNDLELNELASHLKSINSLESYSYVWYKFNKIDNIQAAIEKFTNFSFMFKFLSYLHDLEPNDDLKRNILSIFLLPINNFNTSSDYYNKLGSNFKQKESILSNCLLSSFLFDNFLTIDSFNLSNINSILKHFNLSSKLKKNLLKLLAKVLSRESLSCADNGKYYLLYSILYDYALMMRNKKSNVNDSDNVDDDDDDVLNIFIIYLNNSNNNNNNENNELIETQLFNYLLKYQNNNKYSILNALININNDNFSHKLISNDNFSFINNIYTSIAKPTTLIENDDLLELEEFLLKIFRKYYILLLQSPLQVALNEWIFDRQFYLTSDMNLRDHLIELVNQLFRHYLMTGCDDESQLKRFFEYYSFILDQISNDYYNQDTFDIEIKCLNFYRELLEANKLKENEKLFCEISLPSLMRLVENDYFYSINSKFNYIKNIKLAAANLVIEMTMSRREVERGFDVELVRNVKSLCENYCVEENEDDDKMSLLDDIISSYDYNMNENKISDCY